MVYVSVWSHAGGALVAMACGRHMVVGGGALPARGAPEDGAEGEQGCCFSLHKK
jgi:hypothetical protein